MQQLSLSQLTATGVSSMRAATIQKGINELISLANSRPYDQQTADYCWDKIKGSVLLSDVPFDLHKLLYECIFGGRDRKLGPAPIWKPSTQDINSSNLKTLMKETNHRTYDELFKWSVTNSREFWAKIIRSLSIDFDEPYSRIVDLSDPQTPKWFPGARMNIAKSCFNVLEDKTAIIHQEEGRPLEYYSYKDLQSLASRVANGLRDSGYHSGDCVAIYLPMTARAVAIYLGAILAGCTVVGIAESFPPDEVRTRLQITNTQLVFTQDEIIRDGKTISLYTKIMKATSCVSVVLSRTDCLKNNLRTGDISWEYFLSNNSTFLAESCTPDSYTNILFSSGTTGEPKAIPWNHSTPIKCAADGLLHQDIHPNDVVAWPTSLGWMMGPWLIYASLINRATMALYDGAPTNRSYGQFLQHAGVTILGVVPSIVRTWRHSACMTRLNWSNIRLFSSTGEPSNVDDYLYLMSLADYRPVIEYCGGTEIGGAYLTGSVMHPASPTIFTTPALGTNIMILNDDNIVATKGEAFITLPSIGLSTTLLNQNHHSIYFLDTPKIDDNIVLRRHGDQIEKLADCAYRVHGRVDDTMNISGIKVASVEIERVLNSITKVAETAAVATPNVESGLSQLVIFAVLTPKVKMSSKELQTLFQRVVRNRLNPLFKIHEVKLITALPRTASNKILRRTLRAIYVSEEKSS